MKPHFNMAKQNLGKKVVLIHEGKPVKGIIIEPGQFYYKVNVHTSQVTEIPLPYDMTSVDFDMDYFYCPAINTRVALDKFKRDKKEEEARKAKYKLN